ncbi:MAG TPA: GlsB/YeaQ/YmgE family stress response membrane protein [Arenimonas sp.]|uniref:GlsB/YeaQ/YmgE family stress response membrane protein n=1 Tax=Arenimonas sp. TaxID=1872635 RepID=UPI002BFBE871|nr:GlsB/YeaQ/YmgE family stress response membrane protein [Arenimonas sp.]HMB55915.1 GlsB/YeaQ/YmgE family stress response membrane protein [Arenimonas sp.]
MFSLIWTVLIGFVIGLIARAIHPGDDKLSLLWTIALGVGGSLIAKYLGQAIGWYKEGESSGFILSTVVAVILLTAYSLYKRKQAKP